MPEKEYTQPKKTALQDLENVFNVEYIAHPNQIERACTMHTSLQSGGLACLLMTTLFACGGDGPKGTPDAGTPEVTPPPECEVYTDCPLIDEECATVDCIDGTCVFGYDDGCSCDDDDPCTTDDVYDGGSCVGGATLVCDDNDDNPCTEPKCDPGSGECMETGTTTDAPIEEVCFSYTCNDGEITFTPTQQADDCAAMAPEQGGCTASYVCDADYVGSDENDVCRPVYKGNGAHCINPQGGWLDASSKAATDETLSTCWYWVCYAEQGETVPSCKQAGYLSDEAQTAMLDVGAVIRHDCALAEAVEAGLVPECNDYTCGCLAADCQQAACHAKVANLGESCDTGNACVPGACGFGPIGKTGVCTSTGDVECDILKPTCVVAPDCKPDEGCPAEADIDWDASKQKCLNMNTCADPVNTVCNPTDPAADAVTGCVTQFAAEGTDCSALYAADKCVTEAQCQTESGTIKCLPTATVDCDNSNPCTNDTCVDGICVNDVLDGQPCNDGIACTTGETCSAEATCLGGSADHALCGAGTNACTPQLCLANIGCQDQEIPGCKSAVCVLSGSAGASFDCDLHLVRKDSNVPGANALTFSLSYDNNIVKPVNFVDELCFGGNCFAADVAPGNNNLSPSGHAVGLEPDDPATWSGAGVVMVVQAADVSVLITDSALDDPAFDKADAQFVQLKGTLSSDVPAYAPVLITAKDILASSPDNTTLTGSVIEHMMVLCAPTECTVDNCSNQPISNGCGDVIDCPCPSTACPDFTCPPDGAHTGDTNGDGQVNVSDIQCYISSALAEAGGVPNTMTGCTTPKEWIDLNCDGKITITDVQRSILISLYNLVKTADIIDLLKEKDPDLDGLHNNCDLDDDDDGFYDTCELEAGTDPLDATSVPAQPCVCPNPCP
jgi:hypothetical protein